MPDADLIRSVEQFLYREARLLDERRFHDWLGLFTDDVHYWMTARGNRYPRSSKALASLDNDRRADEDPNSTEEFALFDEDIRTLTARVARLDTGMAWAEDPPSHTCHLISNIAVLEGGRDTQVTVHSNFILYRTRGESEQDFYVGRRQDILRWSGGDWRIAYRKILLPQHVLSAKNASNFF